MKAEGLDLGGREDLRGRGRLGAVAGAHQLHDAGRRNGGEKGQLDKGGSALDLAGLDVEPLALEGPEQLLDVPAPAIPLDDFQGGLRGVDGVGGQQPPMQRLGAGGRADSRTSTDAGRRCPRRPPADAARGAASAGASARPGQSAARAWPAAPDGRAAAAPQARSTGWPQPVAYREQTIAAGELAVLRGARQEVQMGRARPRPALVNVGFAVADHSPARRRPAPARLRRPPPASAAIPSAPSAAGAAHWRRAGPHPQLGPGQPETAPASRLDRQQRVQKQPLVGAVADRAQPPGAPGMALEVELGGVLDRQHMTAPRRQPADPLAGPPVQALQAHPVIAQKPPEPDLLGAIARQLPQPHGRALDHALHKHSPLFPAGHPRTGQPKTRPCRPPPQHVAVGIQNLTQYAGIARPNQRVSQNVTPYPKRCVHR